MTLKIIVPITVLVDIRCSETGCSCEQSALLIFMGEGCYGIQKDDSVCPGCEHEYVQHEAIRETKSESEKRSEADSAT